MLLWLFLTCNIEDTEGRCRWTTNPEEPLLFVKYGLNKLNIIDTEKKALTLKSTFQLDQKGHYSEFAFSAFVFEFIVLPLKIYL